MSAVEKRSRNGAEQDERPKTEEQRTREALLTALATLGGQRVRQDTLKFSGKEFVIPETMGIDDAIEYLHDWRQGQTEETTFSRNFKFRPYDGAYALQSAMVKVFGSAGIQKPTWTFFGKRPPQQVSINVGVNDTVQVPWGQVRVPIFDGIMNITTHRHRELGTLFRLEITAAKRYQAHAEGLFQIVEDELRHYSIYRGKAIDGQPEPEFIDLSGVDPDRVIYSDDVLAQLDANIWSLLQYTEMNRQLKLPLKRANLLYGPFGTGKTLAAYRTAQIATEHEWTFLYCRPARDSIHDVMQTARLYQPAVVFVEDIDTMASEGEGDAVTKLLDLFDGITAKSTEIMVVMTTNHAERIHKGMLRPGRLDSITEISSLDAGGVGRMIESLVPEEMRATNLDYHRIWESMEGYLPAFVKESVDRAVRYALVRRGGEDIGPLQTDDFVHAAEGLRPQWQMMHGAGEGTIAPTLDRTLRDAIGEQVREALDNTYVYPDGKENGNAWAELGTPPEND